MEKFKQRLRIRTIAMVGIMLCIGATNVTLLINQSKLPAIPDSIRGVQTGIFVGLELVLIFYIFVNLGSMRSDDALKKLYIKENDERKRMIRQKTFSIGFEVFSIGLGFAVIISGFFNQIVFFTLLGVVAFVELVTLSLKFYFFKKY